MCSNVQFLYRVGWNRSYNRLGNRHFLFIFLNESELKNETLKSKIKVQNKQWNQWRFCRSVVHILDGTVDRNKYMENNIWLVRRDGCRMRLGVTSRIETVLLHRVANSPLAPAADNKQNNIDLNFKLSCTGIPLPYSILQTFRASYQTDLSKLSPVSHCKTRTNAALSIACFQDQSLAKFPRKCGHRLITSPEVQKYYCDQKPDWIKFILLN